MFRLLKTVVAAGLHVLTCGNSALVFKTFSHLGGVLAEYNIFDIRSLIDQRLIFSTCNVTRNDEERREVTVLYIEFFAL